MIYEKCSSVTRLQIRGISPVRKRATQIAPQLVYASSHTLLFLLRVLIWNNLLHMCDRNVLNVCVYLSGLRV